MKRHWNHSLLPAALALGLAFDGASAGVVVFDVDWTGTQGWRISGTFSYDISAEDPSSPSGGRVDASELVSSSFTLTPSPAQADRWSTASIPVGLAPTVRPFMFLPGSVAFETFAVRGDGGFIDPLDASVSTRTLTFQSTQVPSPSSSLRDSLPSNWETSGTYTFAAVPEPAETTLAVGQGLAALGVLLRLRRTMERREV